MWEKGAEIDGPICQGKVINLIENMDYQFRICAVNKAGVSEPSEPTKTIITKPRFCKSFTSFLVTLLIKLTLFNAKTVAPKIDRRNMRDLILTANSMLKFDVGISGEPVPNVQWTFSGVPLK